MTSTYNMTPKELILHFLNESDPRALAYQIAHDEVSGHKHDPAQHKELVDLVGAERAQSLITSERRSIEKQQAS